MTSQFPVFSAAVNKRLQLLSSSNEFFKVDCPDIFDLYLKAFPAGTDPIFRERTEHDCQCCKQFIRNLGCLVTIKDGVVYTVWGDLGDLPYPYDIVAAKMDSIVKESPILSVFRTKEAKYGVEKNQDSTLSIWWHHFHGQTPAKALLSGPSVGEEIGKYTSVHGVFKRGLEEIRISDLDDVVSLINDNLIYRGQEFLKTLKGFRSLKLGYDQSQRKDLFIWENINSPDCRIRNTVIGTLLIDLNGTDIDSAVRSFGLKMDPTRYKHPTSIITPRMVEQAVFTLRSLDLEDAINRRFASIEDISVNDVIFVDNQVIGKTKGGIEDLLMSEVKPIKLSKNPTPIDIDGFVALRSKKIELILEGRHLPNFVSLTAPTIPGSGIIFKWGNPFAWSYDGGVTDSIKEKVKKAGGNVNAFLRCSLSWFNYDDLDIHCLCPDGTEIFYANKGGVLDVDMNAGGHRTREPVENLSWKYLRDGDYKIYVNQFSQRESKDVGCELEVEFEGKIYQYSYQKAVQGKVHMLTLTVTNGKLSKITTFNGLESGSEISIEKWGIKTLTPTRVNMLMLSPNHWENSSPTGNKHWFFILDKCLNPEPTRGIYNEFLHNSLESHRKVFEVLGFKTKCQPSNNQLSGVGFSSTRSDTVNAIADGRPYVISF